MEDLATALLMVRFYEFHLDGDGVGPLPPPRALRLAQIWLRDVSARELVRVFQEQREIGRRGEAALDPSTVAAGLSRFALEEPEGRPLADPYFWAPFVLVGV